MFIIAGISPKTVQVEASPRRCTFCGLNQVYVTRIDHYLNLFFIPLFRVKKGAPFLFCHHCQRETGPAQPFRKADEKPVKDAVCVRCGSRLEAHFKYCPACGQRR